MNATPERICEALGWLYGGEWKPIGDFYTKQGSGDIEVRGNSAVLHHTFSNRDEGDDITAKLAHAREVTAPWEWKDRYAKLPAGNGEACWFRVGTDGQDHDRFHWALILTDGPNMDEFEETEAAAKTAARAAYLRWMRGGLER